MRAHLAYDERDYTLSKDQELLKGVEDFRVRFCMIYRIERKKILHSHMHLSQILIEFLETESKGKKDYLHPSEFEN